MSTFGSASADSPLQGVHQMSCPPSHPGSQQSHLLRSTGVWDPEMVLLQALMFIHIGLIILRIRPLGGPSELLLDHRVP